jgi:hypothetical protein
MHVFRLLIAVSLISLVPTTALADWADEEVESDDEQDAGELFEHIERADSLAKSPTIPLLSAGLFFGGPIAMLLSGSGGGHGFNFSNGSGVMLATSLSTSITGALIANGIGGTSTTWGVGIAGMSMSLPGFILFQTAVQSYVSPIALNSLQLEIALPMAVAGASLLVVGEIFTMASSGAVEDRYEDMASVQPERRRPPSFAVYAMPNEDGLSVGVAGRF